MMIRARLPLIVACAALAAGSLLYAADEKPATPPAPEQPKKDKDKDKKQDKNESNKDKQQEKSTVPAALNFTMKSLDGKDVNLSKYQGKVVLMVNVASKCGLTPQYKALEAAHEKYGPQGLAILGFPANNFGSQEPGTDAQIGEFCEKNYGVKFDMFSKVSVKGDDKVALYKYLTEQDPVGSKGKEITWNFEKFLLNRKGEVVARFSPQTKPDAPEVIKAIEAELAKK